MKDQNNIKELSEGTKQTVPHNSYRAHLTTVSKRTHKAWW